MKSRITDKIKEIEKFLEFLSNRIPKSLEEYKKNLEIKAICERYIEKIVEASVDLSFMIFKEINKDKKISIPEDDLGIFDILYKQNIISQNLSENLKKAKRMRNIIAHEYGEIDDNIVFNSLDSELINDISELINSINKFLEFKK
jgi:uncharacterized protein YutE (UPF0331/DUF86 family)